MKRYLLILLVAISVKAESLQTLTVLNLSSTNIAGLVWVDKHGGFHALDTTNIVTEAYVAGLLEGYQYGSTILSNFVSLGNGAGVLTNDGFGNISWVIPVSGGGTGDFMANGSVPMTGNFDVGGNSIINTLAVDMTDGSVFNGNTWVGGSTVSSISITADASFGIRNSELAGVGSDINLVSDNGHVVVSPDLTFATGGSISAATFGITTMTFTADQVDFMGAQFLNVTSFYVGSNASDGTGALVESSGDISTFGAYWAGGSQGFTGTLADAITGGNNVIGGIIVQ